MFYRYLFFVLMALSFCAQPRLRAEEHDHDHDKKCLDHHGASSKKESSHAVHAEKEDIVHLNAEQLKMAELDTRSVTSGKLVKTLDGPGEITVNEDRVAHIWGDKKCIFGKIFVFLFFSYFLANVSYTKSAFELFKNGRIYA